jgi:hypothetical protein
MKYKGRDMGDGEKGDRFFSPQTKFFLGTSSFLVQRSHFEHHKTIKSPFLRGMPAGQGDQTFTINEIYAYSPIWISTSRANLSGDRYSDEFAIFDRGNK